MDEMTRDITELQTNQGQASTVAKKKGYRGQDSPRMGEEYHTIPPLYEQHRDGLDKYCMSSYPQAPLRGGSSWEEEEEECMVEVRDKIWGGLRESLKGWMNRMRKIMKRAMKCKTKEMGIEWEEEKTMRRIEKWGMWKWKYSPSKERVMWKLILNGRKGWKFYLSAMNIVGDLG
jgi:hypothetical protein